MSGNSPENNLWGLPMQTVWKSCCPTKNVETLKGHKVQHYGSELLHMIVNVIAGVVDLSWWFLLLT